MEERLKRSGSGTPGMHGRRASGEEVTEDHCIAVLEPVQHLWVIQFKYAANAIGDTCDGRKRTVSTAGSACQVQSKIILPLGTVAD